MRDDRFYVHQGPQEAPKMFKLPSILKNRDMAQGLKNGALGTGLGACIGFTIGFALAASYVLWGWGSVIMVVVSIFSGALLTEGLRRKW